MSFSTINSHGACRLLDPPNQPFDDYVMEHFNRPSFSERLNRLQRLSGAARSRLVSTRDA